jgi:hypothetical protein
MSTRGHKGIVACAPFARRDVKVTVKNGVGMIDQKVTLEGLKVVFGNGEGIEPGDTVWVDPSGARSWGTNVYDVLGERVVLCQPQSVLLVTKAVRPLPPAPSPGEPRTP